MSTQYLKTDFVIQMSMSLVSDILGADPGFFLGECIPLRIGSLSNNDGDGYKNVT